jgi:hypothetical protein
VLGLLTGGIVFIIWRVQGRGLLHQLSRKAWEEAGQSPGAVGEARVEMHELRIAVYAYYSDVAMLGPNLVCPPPTEAELQNIVNTALGRRGGAGAGGAPRRIRSYAEFVAVLKFVMNQLLCRALTTVVVVPICGTLGSVTWGWLTGWLAHATAHSDVPAGFLCVAAFIYDQHSLNMKEPLGGLIFMGLFILLFLCPHRFCLYRVADKVALNQCVVRGLWNPCCCCGTPADSTARPPDFPARSEELRHVPREI